MPLRIVRRGKVWYVRGTVLGQRIYETTGTRERARAELYRQKREAEAWDSRVLGERATFSLADAAHSYLRHRNPGPAERRYVARLLDWFCPGWDRDTGGVDEAAWARLSAIDQALVDRALDGVVRGRVRTVKGKKVAVPPAPASKARVLSVLSAIMNHAAKRGWCQYPRFEAPRAPNQRTRWLTPEEAERLIAAASAHLRPLVVLMLYTGARCSEALELEWRDVDLTAARVRFVRTKNGEARGVPLHERAIAELAALAHRDGPVFRRPDGLPYASRNRLEGGQFKSAFRGAVRRAGLASDVTPHVLRHTWATWLYAETRDIFTLMQLGGWKSQSMVQRYTHVNPDHLAPAIGRLPNLKAVRA